jgi:hypothetical protein
LSPTKSDLKQATTEHDCDSSEVVWIQDCSDSESPIPISRTALLEFSNTLSETFPQFPNPLKHPLKAFAWIVRGAFGIASLVLLLAVVAAIPVVNFLALGYLLEAEGRVARSGKIRDAFPLLGLAPRIGSMALGIGLWILPLILLAGYQADAVLIDHQSPTTSFLTVLKPLLACLVAGHLCLCLARGGKLWHFFWPLNGIWMIRRLRKGKYWEPAQENVRDFISRLQLRHHFSLGLRGYLGAMIWLVLPTALFATARTTEGGPVLLTLLGGLCLIFVFSWLPFLQARFASENRLRTMFEIKAVIECFTKAPLVWFFATVVTFVLALPLYLLKVRLPPQDAMWLATIVFIVSIYPARIVTGLAYGQAVRKEKLAWYDVGWLCRTLMLLLLAGFVYLLFFTQGIGEHGKRTLFEHHAFLLPWPM